MYRNNLGENRGGSHELTVRFRGEPGDQYPELTKLLGKKNAAAIIEYKQKMGTILVSFLELPTLLCEQLELNGIKYLIDLCQTTVDRLMELPHIGKKSLYTIHYVMHRIGIS